MRRQEAVKGEKGVQGQGRGGPSGYFTAPTQEPGPDPHPLLAAQISRSY